MFVFKAVAVHNGDFNVIFGRLFVLVLASQKN